jgi:hypothetical protein
MEIKSLNRQKQVLGTDNADKKKIAKEESKAASGSEEIKDTLEYTPDLLELKPIMDKLKSGFYDNPEVIQKLASILDEKFPADALKEL